MITDFSHAVERTLTIFDQLGAMWGPEIHPSLAVHGLTHDQVHRLYERGCVETGASAEWTNPPYVAARLRTHMGWEVSFFGAAALSSCDRCRELCGLPEETAQLAGVVERMEGGGL